ncbi:MAG: hypothetical protein QGI33_04970, partial [Candidatus Brocadiia bacterium]|nr:hypothetical protein [Candidatus Brocadiia bacterium]
EAVKLRIVAFRPEDFRPLVEFAEQEAREFYDEYREAEPAPDEGTPGYMAPERVRLECAVAELVGFDERVTVSDEEIEQYYAENKEDYLIPEGEEDDSGTEEGADEEAGPEPTEGDDERPERGPRYEPLEEVKEKIREMLHSRKVREAAEVAAKQARDFLDSVRERYPNEPLPLRHAALRNGMTHEQPALAGGVDLLSREELERTVPDGLLVARAVFDEGALENFVITVPDAAGGPMLVQVLEHREPEPREYDEVRERVREDLTIRKALEAAETVAAKLVIEATASSLGRAVVETNRRLDSLLRRGSEGEAGPEDPETGPSAGEDEGDDVDVGRDVSPLLRVEETEFFSHGGITADVPRRAVERAFELGADELARIVEDGADPGCYVIQRIDARPADPAKFHEWLNASQFQFIGYRLAVISMHDKLRQEKARRVVGDWLAGLAEANPVPEEPEQKK